MSNFRRNMGGLVAASLVLGSMVGCGGSGSSNGAPITTQPVVPLTGGAVTTTIASPTAVVASAVPQQIEVTLPGTTQPVVVWIPAGISVAAGQSLAILTNKVTFFQNMTGGASRAPGLTFPGQLLINGLASGITMTNGNLSGDLGLPAGPYTSQMLGPFVVSNGSQQLNVQEFDFTFESNGTALSLPTVVTGLIPGNGSSNFTNRLNLNFDPAYDSGTASMKIVHANGTLQKTVPVSGPGCVFYDLGDGKNAQIPIQGVDTVSFSH